MNWRAPTLLSLALLTACGHDNARTEAEHAFAAFQAALQRRDESACRELLTAESAAALADMSWQHVAAQRPLEVLGSRHEHGEYRIQVADPNADGQRSEFVVVREYGRLVVDLVATAAGAAHAANGGSAGQATEAAGSREQFEPRALTPADFDRIREYELAQPRR